MISCRFNFKSVDTAHRSLVHSWLTQPYVAKWFYGQGLENTLKHLEEFLQGSSQSQYWLAYDKEHPFAFFITSSVDKPHDVLASWCSEEGEAITLDMLIGDTHYLGKGLSHILIQEFLDSQFPQVAEVLIDPEATNSHAIHVYKKIGFKILGKFIPSHSPHSHYMMHLNRKKTSSAITVRSLCEEDLNQLIGTFTPPWSTKEKITQQWAQYFQEQQQGKRTVCVLERQQEFLGYGSLLRSPDYSYFKDHNIPEINAVWIAEESRRQGLGKMLITHLENIAQQEDYRTIGIGVGLYKDYGPAQKLYFKLGYRPDGNGMTYQCQAVVPGKEYRVDDDLILWLTKSLYA